MQKNGLFFGKNFISSIAAPIPFLQSFLINLFKLNPNEIETASFVTYLGLGRNPTWGLGTNMIGGIYLSFGLTGVLIIMFLFGSFMRIIYNKSRSNIVYLIIYIIMISNSIYLCRTDITTPLRLILWSIFIYYLFFRTKIKKYNYPQNLDNNNN